MKCVTIYNLFWGPTCHPPPILGTISHLCFGATDHLVWESFIFLSPVLGVHHPSALGVISRLINAFGVVSCVVLWPLLDYLIWGAYLLPDLGCPPPICFREPLTMNMLGQPSHLVHIHYNPLSNLSSDLNSSIQPR